MARWLVLPLILILSVGYSAAQTNDEEIWRHFVAWISKAEPVDSPLALFQAYEKELMAEGATADEASRRRLVATRLMRIRDDGWQVMFNNIYANATPGFSTRPNGTLVAAVSGRTPGRALDAGMGQGRNSVFLALNGWDVTGFDISDGGLAVAQKDAARAGVKIKTVQTSYSKFDYGSSQWDLIAFTYVPFPLIDPAYVKRLSDALKPGGMVVIESFASASTAQGRRPVDFDPIQLKEAFKDFKIVRFDDVEERPDWADAKARLIKMVVEKR